MIEYIDQKRALGYKCNSYIETINLFDDFCNMHNVNSPVISKKLLDLWEEKSPNESETYQHLRIIHIRQFCIFLHNNGYDAPYLFHAAPKVSVQFSPYIFSKDELSRFFAAVDSSKRSVNSPLRHLVMPVLFRLMYSCGLRISEALHLKTKDVDLEQGVLTILNAKGDKDRLVAISDSMLKHMRQYRSDPVVSKYDSDYFFPSPDGGFYNKGTIYQAFRKYLQDAGIQHNGRGNGPRLHDFRHTFAVHLLTKWSKEGKDMYVCLPILRIYLGHSHLRYTEKYLKLIPESYPELTEPFNNRFKRITEVISSGCET